MASSEDTRDPEKDLGDQGPVEEKREPEAVPAPEAAEASEAPFEEKDDGEDIPPERKKLALLAAGGALAVVILCVIVIAAAAGRAVLNRVTRPEFTEKDMTPEEIQYWATYNPDGQGEYVPGAPEETEEPETVAPTLPPVEGDYITNILVIGQDYRYGEDTKLADSMILCSLNRKSKTLTLTSFLRDTYIQMPNFKGHTCGKNRINVVYNLGWKWAGELGGMEMMDLCLQNNFGIEVDYNVEVNFETFQDIINLIGGVDIELTEAEANYLLKDKTGYNDYVVPGMNHLRGYATLCYARARKLDGDIQRTNRQRKVVSAIIDQVRDMRFTEIMELVWDTLPLIITDMSNEEISSFLKDVIPMLPELTIEAGTCPAEGTYWGEMISIAGYPSSVLKYYPAPNQQRLQAICEVPAYEASLTEPTEP